MNRRLIIAVVLVTTGFLFGAYDASAGGGCNPGFPVCGFDAVCGEYCEAFECDSAECNEKEFLDICFRCVPNP